MLYFFEGAPMGLIWWTIPTLLSLQGFSVETITTLGASATLPWAFKFLLGPVADRFLFTTKHHAWTIAGLQVGVGLGVFSILITPMDNPLILYCVLIMSFFSAMQDVVIDAWAIAAVDDDSRGRINGAMQVGMLSGRWFFGAGLLMALSYISLPVALITLLGLIFASIIFLVSTYRKSDEIIAPSNIKLGFKSFEFIIQSKFILLAIIALTTGFALEAFTAVISVYLVDFGLTRTSVGMVLSFTLLCMLIGAVVGGYVSDFIGDLKTFAIATLAMAFAVTFMGFYDGFTLVVFLTGVFVTYFGVGFFTASSYTYYMNQSQGQMEASKFTYLMAIANLCEVFAAYGMGRMVTLSGGYKTGFLVCVFISLIGLALLMFLRLRQNSELQSV